MTLVKKVMCDGCCCEIDEEEQWHIAIVRTHIITKEKTRHDVGDYLDFCSVNCLTVWMKGAVAEATKD